MKLLWLFLALLFSLVGATTYAMFDIETDISVVEWWASGDNVTFLLSGTFLGTTPQDGRLTYIFPTDEIDIDTSSLPTGRDVTSTFPSQISLEQTFSPWYFTSLVVTGTIRDTYTPERIIEWTMQFINSWSSLVQWSGTDTASIGYTAIWFTKTVNDTGALPWDIVTYTLEYYNTGTFPLAVSIVDFLPPSSDMSINTWFLSLPANVTYSGADHSLRINTALLPNERRTYQFTWMVLSNFSPLVDNRAIFVGARHAFSVSVSSSASIIGAAGLTITKTPAVQFWYSWLEVAFTLTVTNSWTQPFDGLITDVLPDELDFVSSADAINYINSTERELIFVPFTDLDPGDTLSFSFTGRIVTGQTFTPFINSWRVDLVVPGGFNLDATSLISPIADLVVTASMSNLTGPQQTWDPATYTITITNQWAVSATWIELFSSFPTSELNFLDATVNGTPVSFTIDISGDLVFPLVDLAPGESATLVMNTELNAWFSVGDMFRHVWRVITASDEFTLVNNSYDLIDNVKWIPDLTITKTHLWSSPYQLSWEIVSFELRVNNTGNRSVTGAVLEDILPSELTYLTSSLVPSLVSGQQVFWTWLFLASGMSELVITVDAVINDNYVSWTVFTNTGMIRMPVWLEWNEVVTIADTPTNNIATASWSIAGAPDLYITKTLVSSSPSASGDLVVYRLTYGNSGTASTSWWFTVTDIFPTELTNIQTSPLFSAWTNPYIRTFTTDLTPWQTWSITITGSLRDSASVLWTTFTNTGTISTTGLEVATGNNSSSITDVVWWVADLAISKSVTWDARIVWDQVTFTLSYENTWSQSASSVVVRDILPDALSYVAWSSVTTPLLTPSEPSIDGNVLSRTIGTLASWTQGTITFDASLNTFVSVATLTNTGDITTSSREVHIANNTWTVSFTTLPIGNAFITKSLVSAGSWTLNAPFVFALDFGNTGTVAMTWLTVSDVIPPMFTYAGIFTATPSTLITSLTDSAGVLTSNSFDLAVGQTWRVEFTLLLNQQLLTWTNYTNTGIITYAWVEWTLTDNQSVLQWTIDAALDIVVTKTFLPERSGGNMDISWSNATFVIEYVNNGTVPVSWVTLIDNRPSPAHLVFGSTSNGSIPPVLLSSFDIPVGWSWSIILIGQFVTRNFGSLINEAVLTFAVWPTEFTQIATVTINEPAATCGDFLLSRTEECDRTVTGAIMSTRPLYTGQVCSATCQIETEFAINTAQMCLYTDTSSVAVDEICQESQVRIDIDDLGEPDIRISKTVDDDDVERGDDVTFTVEIENVWDREATNVVLTDIRPDDELDFQDFDISPTFPGNLDDGRTIGVMQPGDSITLELEWEADVDDDTAVNRATVERSDGANTFSRSDEARVDIDDDRRNDDVECDFIEVDDRRLFLTEDELDDGDARIRVTCEAEDEADDLEIDCGNGDDFTERDDDRITGTCRYDDFDDYTIRCYVDGETNSSCREEVSIEEDEPERFRCGDGEVSRFEQCDLWPDVDDFPWVLIEDYLDSDEDLRAGRFAWARCYECEIVESEVAVTPPACFYTDTAISVQEGEILPFWRELDIDPASVTNSCSANGDDDGKVVQWSFICDFSLFNKDGEVLREGFRNINNVDCAIDMRQWQRIFDYFLEDSLFIDTTRAAYGKYFIRMPELAWLDLGEYKISLEQVRYDYCDWSQQVRGTPFNRVCQVNVAVTRPYLMQRGAVSSVTNDNLDDFFSLDGWRIVDDIDLRAIDTINGSFYNGWAALDTLLNGFVQKYETLAITIPWADIDWLVAGGLAKVPWKDIFVLWGDGLVTYQERADFEKPVTIIVPDGDLVINGNVWNPTMFIVPNGNIYFKSLDCRQRQYVNGIFVAGKPFEPAPGIDGKILNSDLWKDRCQQWWLTIQWVVVGDDIVNGLVQTRRSQLNDWFVTKAAIAPGPNFLQQEQRDKVFNGAAVLIQHNPTLRTNQPPGMEDLMSVLQVYRK